MVVPHRSQVREQEIWGRARNKGCVNADDQLVRDVWSDQDDVLASLALVRGDRALEGRLFGQLVDLLVEGMFLDLRQSFHNGHLGRDAYVAELGQLVEMCRTAGLLPLRGRIR